MIHPSEVRRTKKAERRKGKKRRTGFPRRGELLSGGLVDNSGGARAREKNAARDDAFPRVHAREERTKARNRPHTSKLFFEYSVLPRHPRRRQITVERSGSVFVEIEKTQQTEKRKVLPACLARAVFPPNPKLAGVFELIIFPPFVVSGTVVNLVNRVNGEAEIT